MYVEKIEMNKIAVLIKTMKGRIFVTPGVKPYITVKRAVGQHPLETLKEALTLLKQATESEEQ